MSDQGAAAPTQPAPPTNETLILLVRVGTFYDDKDKPYHRFHRVVDDELGGTLAFEFSKDNKHIHGVGLLYEVTEIAGADGPRWRIGNGKYKGFWHEKNDRLTWDAAQVVRDAERNAAAKHKKAVDDRPLQHAIAPLRDLYRSQVANNRSQLLAYIVKEITK